MKLAGTERMQWFPACVAFTLSTKKSPTNRIWPPLGDWPLRPNYVRYRNVWYLVGKIIHRAIFSQKLKFLPWSSDALLAIKVPAGEKDPPRGFKGKKSPGPIGLSNLSRHCNIQCLGNGGVRYRLAATVVPRSVAFVHVVEFKLHWNDIYVVATGVI